MNPIEDVVDEIAIGSDLLGLKELQPESMSHSGTRMTDLGDKSQVISRSAEAGLTKKDLRGDDHRDHEDKGAPLDFSSSLSSITGLLSPNDEDKERVSNELPRGSPGDNPADDPSDPHSIEKQYEFAKFNQKFIPSEEGAALGVPEPRSRLVPGEGGIAEGGTAEARAASASTTLPSLGSSTLGPSLPHPRLVPGKGECAQGQDDQAPAPSPRG